MTDRIITRAEWGARYANGQAAAPVPADETWLHHSVTIAPDLVPPFDDDYAAVRRLEDIGQQRFGAGISYTFPITPAGLIFEGHSIGRRGTHTGGRNTRARAICFVGNYEANQPTDAQIEAAAWLLAHGFLAGWWKAADLTGGHRDVRSTSCPGRYAYAAMGRIDARAAQIAAATVRPTPAPTPKPTPAPSRDWLQEVIMSLPVLRRGSSGAPVRRVQGLLVGNAHNLRIDGDYGPVTEHNVKAFQRHRGLAADGIVGPNTYTRLLKG